MAASIEKVRKRDDGVFRFRRSLICFGQEYVASQCYVIGTRLGTGAEEFRFVGEWKGNIQVFNCVHIHDNNSRD